MLLTSRMTLTFQGYNPVKSQFGTYLGYCWDNCHQILTQSIARFTEQEWCFLPLTLIIVSAAMKLELNLVLLTPFRMVHHLA